MGRTTGRQSVVRIQRVPGAGRFYAPAGVGRQAIARPAGGASGARHFSSRPKGIFMNIVLLHGSWHGAWCWHKVVPLLQARGHQVHVPDLPAHGRHWRVARGRTTLSASGGALADHFGWTPFFLLSTAACLPGLAALVWLMRSQAAAVPARPRP